HAFHEGLHVGLQDAALRPAAALPRQIDAELACELAHRWAGMRLRRRFLLRLARHWTRGRSRSDRRRGRRGRRRLWGSGLWRPGKRLVFRLEHEDRRIPGNLVADPDPDLLHHARSGGGDFHRRLVRLQRDQRLLLGHGFARLHEYLDDLYFLEVADVRNDHLTHTVVGSGLSASMPYFFIASATLFALPSPWSASAFRAATATKWRLTSKKCRSLGRVSERPKPSVPRTRYTRSLGMSSLSWSAKIFM